MFGRKLALIISAAAIAVGLTSCDRMKTMFGSGGPADFRNAQIDVSGTACSDNGKFATLVLKDGKYELAQYQFELFGDPKTGDVSGHTTTGATDSNVFVGNCAISGQTSQLLFVYGTENGAPKRLGSANLTENGKGLVQSYDVKDSTILVEQNLGNPPTLSKTSYALLNGKLTDLSPQAPVVTPVVAQNDDLETDVISYQSFHDKLQPYGKWVDHPRWGWAWHPTQANFRPYENGHWEDSDEYGSVWVSADPWGDTPYHYGRWGYDPNYGGWLWVPSYVWGPSWVAWRANDNYLGWFPIPPGTWDGEGDYPDEWASLYGYRGLLDAAAFYGLWSFVPAVDIFAGDVRGRIADRRGYGSFIDHTHNWGHYGLSHGHVVSRAFDHNRFAANFHHGLPGGTRHDFASRHVASFSAGRHIAEHERIAVHSGTNVHGIQRVNAGGVHERMTVHSGNGFAHAGSYHHEGYAHSGSMSGYGRTGSYHSSGFSRTGGGESGFSRTGSYRSSGYSHTGGTSEGGYGRTGSYRSSGNSRSSGGESGFSRGGQEGGGFSHSNASSGGGFGHQNSGGFGRQNGGQGSGGGMQRPATPAAHSAPPQQNNSGGEHHHH
jgi:hypothetical protein